MKRATILIADGFEEAEALVPYDILKRAGVETDLVSVSGEPTAVGGSGLLITGLISMEGYPFEEADCLILPGGSAGYEVLRANPTVKNEAVAFANDPNKVLAGICASGALLGQYGLLKGKNYTCYPTMDGDFGGTYRRQYAVTDGNIVTGIGPGGAFAFGYSIAQKLAGEQKAQELRDAMCWDLEKK